ncbi:MCE family protein [Nocardia uniformis]|uniref:MCE family protein n=1 Tax=Nocardia uniformis TaxID=53432 RepID=A0A849BWH2_9NOCA|nr:MlaD family protein [Nocardia uniformis]NNH70912.1 MCE family protein [Nocardia uniformis]
MRLRLCAAIGSALLVTGCGVEAIDLPIPGVAVSGPTYTISVQFANVLNLTGKAEVQLNGIRVGVLKSTSVANFVATAVLELSNDVQVPNDTKVELRQATLLGDIYIALTPPPGSTAPPLPPGAVVPVSQTMPAQNLEELIRGFASVLNGGTSASLTSGIARINAAMPPQDELRDLLLYGRDGISQLAGSTGELDQILTSAAALTQMVADNQELLDALMRDVPARASTLAGAFDQFGRFAGDVPTIGDAIVKYLGGQTGADITSILAIVTPLVGVIATADLTLPQLLGPLDALRQKLTAALSTGNFGIAVDRLTVEGGGAPSPELWELLRKTGMVS